MSQDRRQREEYDDDVGSAKQWAEAQGGGSRTALKPCKFKPFIVKKQPQTLKLDFVPFLCGEGNPNCGKGRWHWERTYYTHPRIGASNDTYICPAMTCGLPCFVCEYKNRGFDKLRNTPNPDEERALKDLHAKKRQMFLVVDRDATHPDEPSVEDVMLWSDWSYHCFGDSLKNKLDSMDADDDFDRFASLTKGYTVRLGMVMKSMGGGGKPFPTVGDIEFRPRKKPLENSLREHGVCLDELLNILPYEKLKAVFLQEDASKKEEEGEEGQVRQRNGSRETQRVTQKDVGTVPDDEPSPPRRRRQETQEEDLPPSKPRLTEETAAPQPSGNGSDHRPKMRCLYRGGEYEVLGQSPDGKLLTLEDEDGVVMNGVKAEKCEMVPFAEGAGKPTQTQANTTAVADDDDDIPPPKRKRP